MSRATQLALGVGSLALTAAAFIALGRPTSTTIYGLVWDPVAWAWLAASGIALALGVFGIRDGIDDLRALAGAGNGRRDIAIDYIRSQAIRALAAAGWLAAGTPAYFDSVPTPLTAFTGILVGTNVLLAYGAWASRRTRLRLLRGTAR